MSNFRTWFLFRFLLILYYVEINVRKGFTRLKFRRFKENGSLCGFTCSFGFTVVLE